MKSSEMTNEPCELEDDFEALVESENDGDGLGLILAYGGGGDPGVVSPTCW